MYVMDFSNYAILTDLDGTFLHHGNTVPKNIEAVEDFVTNGGLFTIATGRIKETAGGLIPQLGRLINAPAVLCNGSYLYEHGARKTMMETFIEPAHAQELLDFIACYCPQAAWRVSGPKGMRTLGANGNMAQDFAMYGRAAFEILPDLADWPLDDWYKLVFRGEGEELAQIRASFELHFAGHRLMALKSGDRLLEIFYRDCHKGTGLEKLREVCDLGARTVIACGDFENDIEMLESADIAVCPANALPRVKEVSDFVLCDSSEGLLAAVIEAIADGKLKKEG